SDGGRGSQAVLPRRSGAGSFRGRTIGHAPQVLGRPTPAGSRVRPQPLLPPDRSPNRTTSTAGVAHVTCSWRSNLGSRLLTVALGCTRLHSSAAPLAVSCSDCTSRDGRATHNLCEKAQFSVTSVTALLAQELRVPLDFVRRSNCRRFSLCGCHLLVVTL